VRPGRTAINRGNNGFKGDENAATVQALLDNLISRGLDPTVPSRSSLCGALFSFDVPMCVAVNWHGVLSEWTRN
jgi:hypothetical protein